MSNVVGSNANNGNKRKREDENATTASKRAHPLAPNGAPNPAEEEHHHHQAQAALESYPDPTSAFGNTHHDSSTAATEAAILQFNDPAFLVHSQAGVPDQGDTALHGFSLGSEQPGHTTNSPYNLPGYADPTRTQPHREGSNTLTPYTGEGGPNVKPAVGTEEWHQIRKDNHKEVERRRRETINEGINALAQIVPEAEKNKGAILSQAVKYIHELEAQIGNASRGTSLEHGTTMQALREVSSVNEELKHQIGHANEALVELGGMNAQLKAENENALRMIEALRKRVLDLGGKVDDLEEQDEGIQILEGEAAQGEGGREGAREGQGQVQTANMGGPSTRR